MSWGSRLFQEDLALNPGQEWWQTYQVWTPGVLSLTAAGDRIFYVGLYTAAQFQATRSRNPGRFPFLLGSARTTHFLRYTIAQPGPYVVVIRMSGWAGAGGPFKVRFTGEMSSG
jgi:hypothetical protein